MKFGPIAPLPIFKLLRLAAVCVLLAGCSSVQATPIASRSPTVATQSNSIPLAQPAPCEGQFVTHNLDVANGVKIRDIGTYLSNGSGVAVADLNGDGKLDIVLGSIDGESIILWNQGDLTFKDEPINDSFTRAVSAVDVDGDGQIDLVFTHTGIAGITYWHNQNGRFSQQALPGVDYHAYSMAWGDLNGDGALDLVTGSYNTDLKQHISDAAALKSTTGIIYYEHQGDQFKAQRLTQTAEALSLGLVDVNGDGKLDIWAANDFLVPDMVWLRKGNTWQSVQPFRRTSYSTMSIDWGDLSNNGGVDLFSTDMNPNDISTANLARWIPVMNKLEQGHDPNDPQIMANMLQAPLGAGKYLDEAARRGIDASGWSWAGRFGDLNNDGYLDLYIVNGMIAKNLFYYLPNYELVEQNQAFRNLGNGNFTHADEWGLNASTSGRGMVMADLNMDGKLDVVVNNLRAPAQVFENRLCGGDAIEVDLRWPASKNPFAIGAHLELQTSMGTMLRDVRASGGYLSTDPARMHFGFPAGTQLKDLRIRWPDGAVSDVQNLQPHTLLQVTR